MLSPFLVSPQKTSYSLPSCCSLSNPLLLSGQCIPLYWSIEPSQDQGPLLQLMSQFCLVVYYWGALGLLVSSYCSSSYGPANPFSSSVIGDPVLRLVHDWEHQMSLNRGMDTENMVHFHNGVLLSY